MIDFEKELRLQIDISNNLRVQVAGLQARNYDLISALRQIYAWEMPSSGRFHQDGSPMSYEFAFGSNGERDFIRALAKAAIGVEVTEPKPVTGEDVMRAFARVPKSPPEAE